MEAAKLAQRIGVILAHTLLSEARKPISVSYESDQGVDMSYTLCSAFYVHMSDLQNLMNMPIDLWISVVYKLNEAGDQDLGFAVAHEKVPACELKVYPLPSINYAAEAIKRFMAYSMLPYFDIDGVAAKTNLAFLQGKYGKADGWGDTITLHIKAEDFPYDVDYAGGVFRGFSERLMEAMKRDVATAIGITDDLRHRVYSMGNEIGIVFVPESTYLASREVPKEL
jgi:hypothetical protein